MSEADTSNLLSKGRLDEMLRILKEEAAAPKYSRDIFLPLTDMSGSMSEPPTKEAYSKTIATSVMKHFNATDYIKTGCNSFIGSPPGYKAPPLTPEQKAAMREVLQDITAAFGKSASIRNGERLAAQCHAGVSIEGMKPLRLRLKSSSALASLL